ncbi:DUF3237 domain-containing protein [Mucilaginibacter sp.]|jgi:hypothetical protein|uniref:DUF3237 domain-containing protein n=1 Tax=Mucilaginibacter sp. TaxID=1882438 RepID=UPI003565EF49
MSNPSSFENLPEVLKTVKTKPLLTLKCVVGPAQIIGNTPGGNHLVGVLQSGFFEGERLSGEVLPGGSDWQTIRTDGSILLDCKLVLKTSDGEIISLKYTGVRVNPPSIQAQMAKGEAIRPEDYYLRIVPVFETASEKYAWINNVVAIGIGNRQPDGPHYSMFEVL